MPVLRFVALGRFHKRTLFEFLFYFAGIYISHGLVQRVQFSCHESFRYFIRLDETVGGFVFDVDDELGASLTAYIRFIECGNSHCKVNDKCQVDERDEQFFPFEIHGRANALFFFCFNDFGYLWCQVV